MPAKTASGHNYGPQPNAVASDDSLNASNGALFEADAKLGLTERTLVFFDITGDKRPIQKGDLYLIGACVYVANNAGDEYPIVSVRKAE